MDKQKRHIRNSEGKKVTEYEIIVTMKIPVQADSEEEAIYKTIGHLGLADDDENIIDIRVYHEIKGDRRYDGRIL